MEWILVALVIGAMVYSREIVVEYTNYVAFLRPRIAGTEESHRDLLVQMNEVEVERMHRRDRIDDLRIAVSDLSRKVSELRSKVLAEQSRKQRLEMEYHKERLKSGAPSPAY